VRRLRAVPMSLTLRRLWLLDAPKGEEAGVVAGGYLAKKSIDEGLIYLSI
jgi:hypothetical protein